MSRRRSTGGGGRRRREEDYSYGFTGSGDDLYPFG